MHETLEGGSPVTQTIDTAPLEARVLVMLGGIPLHGQERGNIQVFKSLAQVGVESLFVTHSEYGHEAIQPALDRLGLNWTTGVYPERLSRGMSGRQWLSRLSEIRKANRDFFGAVKDFDPTHIHICNEGHLLAMLPAVIGARRKVIFRVGDAPRNHRPVFRYLWRHIFSRIVDHFVCNSTFIERRLLEAGVPSHKISHIYTLPPDRPRARADDDRWLGGSMGESKGDEKLAWLSSSTFEGCTFTYMGQLTKDKGVDVLVAAALRACRERDDVRFLIAGDYVWQNPFAEDLMRQVDQAGLTDRIVFLGFVEDIPQLLDLGDVHVCPSVWEEPLSNTVLEAKRASRPSIVFASGGLPELVDDGVDGWIVTDKSEHGLMSALETAANLDGESLAQKKEAARSSLDRLGITPQRFTAAWAKVYATVS